MARLSENHPGAVRVTAAITGWLGSLPAIFAALGLILLWAISGPLFGFSDTWQLIINTVTTLVTFVMVFVIQSSQNRDNRAIQVKLDEILYVLTNADDDLVGIEDLPEPRIKALQKHVREEAAAATSRPSRRGNGNASRESSSSTSN